MAKNGKHVIHAGGVFINPMLNREGAAAVDTLPGTIGYFDKGKFKASVDGKEAVILYVANIDYLRCQTVDDPITAGGVVVGIHPMTGMFLNVRATEGIYKKGQAVAVANGQIKAISDGAAFAYIEEDSITAKAGDLVRVVFK
ncbi:hypothetical protein [Xenorhabdus griffiniae]|uniref:Uncharacterized protein n=1 Tax=Xenorhabdus griffiniae TaxID=351672 RepID=A0ABY9XMA2_9GAMM|nr:hypothetical protein [Xenorhabdus griffiniae]MBD1228324.1 hypothetical protein [Xenorhabdus griffiniae]MBE8587761.1 hypothetical protein [Xenorhabdus griffiniae]WMV74038.1 hypothetical protein QL128_08610 [Xenorhabdus griffiniae]WNH03718.1 hypothetical protein QL112_008615 [Xenorhabdus griffiniae]